MMQFFSVALIVTSISATAFAADGTLYTFKGAPGPASPYAPLVTDPLGNLYGTTHYGGAPGEGTVFELSPNGSGQYTFTQLYAFQSDVGDAIQPDSGVLLRDSAGNLYGTTMYGGNLGGLGAVYEVSSGQEGTWTEKVLHSFGETVDNNVFYPGGGVIMDAAGNLYGVATNGGPDGLGGVFELSPDGSGGWTERVIHNFAGPRYGGPDGGAPLGGLVFDAAGNLYGTTLLSGEHDYGAVFELSPGPGGTWTEQLIHSFTGNDGCDPQARLIIDSAGNLYGTTYSQGATYETCGGWGTVFRLTPGSGGWTETVLHRFGLNSNDGALPNGIVMDSAGDIYGTTFLGGEYGAGTVYKLTPNPTGLWNESPVHIFDNNAAPGGFYPVATVIFGIDGSLYGTTSEGGGPTGKDSGTVFKLQP